MPMFISNLWQFWKAENHFSLINQYKFFAFFMMVLILLTSFYAVNLGDNLIRLIFGFIVLVFVIFRGNIIPSASILLKTLDKPITN